MKYLSLILAAFLFTSVAYASEYTGTVTTGVTTGVEASVATTPTASPVAGSYTSAQSVTLTADGNEDDIRYTIDATAPTCSTGTEYMGAINVSSSLTIRAIACYGGVASAVGTFADGVHITRPSRRGGGGRGPSWGAASAGGGGGKVEAVREGSYLRGRAVVASDGTNCQ